MRRRFFSVGKVVRKEEWLQTAKGERNRVNSLLNLGDYQDRNHPIYNFIFIYFFFNRKILFQYSPGIDVQIEAIHDSQELMSINLAPELQPVSSHQNYLAVSSTEKKIAKKFLQRTLQIQKSIQSKLPSFWCFGLHEWAMQYHSTQQISQKNSSFQSLPLRVTQQQIESLLNPARHEIQSSVPRLRCTHYDAIRFFTPSSVPLNAVSPSPTRSTVDQFDQPGCIHVNMDLFKYAHTISLISLLLPLRWAAKLYPFIPSSLLIDALEIALRAREIDMRASPYDLTAYKGTANSPTRGLGSQFSPEPICVETPAVSLIS
jgi:hypothetical protein